MTTAESWRVKLSDFGNAILFPSQIDSDRRILERIPGTPFYRPPEADNINHHLTTQIIPAIDIWGWGLLLWQVLIGGGSFLDDHGEEIEADRMDDIRRQDAVADVAWKACSKSMRENHFDEQARFREGLKSALLQSLAVDPKQRPSADQLLQRMETLLSEQ